MSEGNVSYLDEINAESLVSLQKCHASLGLRCDSVVKYPLHNIRVILKNKSVFYKYTSLNVGTTADNTRVKFSMTTLFSC